MRVCLRVRRRLVENRIKLLERQAQKLLFITPLQLCLDICRTIDWRRRRICDLCDQVRSRRFRNPIDQNTKKRHAKQRVEANAKAKKQPFSALEPRFLLLLRHVDAGKVRLKQLSHQALRREVRLEEDDKATPREEDARTEDDARGAESDGSVEGVKTCHGQNKAADEGQEGRPDDGQGYQAFPGKTIGKHGDCLGRAGRVGTAILLGVLPQIGIVHVPQFVGVVILVFLDISHVHPLEGVHEPASS